MVAKTWGHRAKFSGRDPNAILTLLIGLEFHVFFWFVGFKPYIKGFGRHVT